MADTYTTGLRVLLMEAGTHNNTWGDLTNGNWNLEEAAIRGYTTIALTGSTVTLTTNNATADEARSAFLEFTGVLTSNIGVVIPSVSKGYEIRNATSGAFTITLKANGGTGLVIPQGGTIGVICDSASVYQSSSRLLTLDVQSSTSLGSNLTVAGALNVTGAVSTAGALTVTGATNITGAVSTAGALTVSGATSVGALTAAAVSASSLALTTPLSVTMGGTGTTTGAGLIQCQVTVFTGVSASGGVALPVDNSIPTNSEGTQMLTLAVTPKSATSRLRVQVEGMFSLNFSANNKGAIALYRDSGAAFIARAATWATTDEFVPMALDAVVSSDATSATTFKLRIGPNNASDNMRVNGNSGGQIFGGVSQLTMVVTEFTSVA